MKLIVGLGNPGEKYASVRHNLGFAVVDQFIASSKYQVVWEEEKKFKSQVAKISPEILCAKPLTYMNNSGLAVALLTTYYQLFASRSEPTTNLIVIHDDLDLSLGKIKIRLGGAAAGHHGVESIISALGTDQFIRVRLGILGGLKVLRDKNFNAESFVLEPFMHQEKSKVKHMIKQAVLAIELLLEKGLAVAQNQYN